MYLINICNLKKSSKILFLITLLSGCLIIINGCKDNTDIADSNIIETNELKNEDYGPIYNEDGTIELGLGYTAFGFYDMKTGDIIDNRSLYIPKDNKITGTVSFQQNLEGEYNYLLLTMVDYVQQSFKINSKEYKNYYFTLSGEAEININIEIEIPYKNAKEFTYFIVPEPDLNNFLNDGSFDWDVMLNTRESYIYRISLQENYESMVDNFDTNFEIIKEPTALSGFELTKSHKDIIPVVDAKSGEDLELVFLNENAVEETYVLIAFLGWEQIEFEDGNKNKMVKVPENSSIYYTLKLSDSLNEQVFQVFALNKPYVTLQEEDIHINKSIFRVLLHDN